MITTVGFLGAVALCIVGLFVAMASVHAAEREHERLGRSEQRRYWDAMVAGDEGKISREELRAIRRSLLA